MQLDVVIVGGGLVGASLALALGQAAGQRHKIMLVDAFPLTGRDNFSPSFSSKTTALSHSSRVIYEKLGIWELLQTHSAPIAAIHVSEKGRWGATRLIASEHGLTEFGHVAANEAVGQALLSTLHKQQKVILESPSQVIRIQRQTTGYMVTVKPANASSPVVDIPAKLVVIADGGRSPLLEQLGIDLLTRDYHQHALVANLTVSRPHQHIAYERFTGAGAMALLPLPDFAGRPQYSLVWTIPEEQVDRVLALPDEEFLAELQHQVGFRCGKFLAVGPRTNYPLSLSQATEQVRPGLVILGNAAHTLHPVAGQGYNLSLRDAMTLAELVNHVTTSEELLSDELVRHYLQRQQEDQRRVIKASDGLIKLFGARTAMLRQGRQFGLIALNLLSPAKQLFAEMAMGVAGVAADWQS
jgi:2-octaprenyl-6-methoxyphenol hydroxylase